MTPETRLEKLKQLKRARAIVASLEAQLQLPSKPVTAQPAAKTRIISDHAVMMPEDGEQVLFAPNQARIAQ